MRFGTGFTRELWSRPLLWSRLFGHLVNISDEITRLGNRRRVPYLRRLGWYPNDEAQRQ